LGYETSSSEDDSSESELLSSESSLDSAFWADVAGTFLGREAFAGVPYMSKW